MAFDNKKRLSSDRLHRVQGEKGNKSCSRNLVFKRISEPQDVLENEEVKIGDWCIFLNDDERRCNSKYLLGCVHDFQYIKGKSINEKKYTWDYARMKPLEISTNNRGINVLALWYALDLEENNHQPLKINSFYINIDGYVSTLSSPSFRRNANGTIQLEAQFFSNIQEALKKQESKRRKNDNQTKNVEN